MTAPQLKPLDLFVVAVAVSVVLPWLPWWLGQDFLGPLWPTLEDMSLIHEGQRLASLKSLGIAALLVAYGLYLCFCYRGMALWLSRRSGHPIADPDSPASQGNSWWLWFLLAWAPLVVHVIGLTFNYAMQPPETHGRTFLLLALYEAGQVFFGFGLVPTLLYAVLTAVGYESWFRGYFFTRVGARMHPSLAIPVTAVFFAIASSVTEWIGYMLPLGMLLGLLRCRTGKLWPSIATHAAYLIFTSSQSWPTDNPFGWGPLGSSAPSLLAAVIVAAVALVIDAKQRPRLTPAPAT